MTSSLDPWAVVVGAGPAGLLLSLLLARAKIPVVLVEKESKLDTQPRATHYAPPAVEILRRAGVTKAMTEAGFNPDGLTFRTLTNTVLTSLDHTPTGSDPNRMICLPLNQLGQILLDALSKEPTAVILWNHEVTAISDDAGTGVVAVSTPDGSKDLRAKYVVGCDGANSKIRRLLFGDWEFPGKTWPVQVVATNVYYDFHQFGYQDANFIIDPEHWYMASRITRDGMWRVSYGESASRTKEELMASQPEKWRRMLPGSPSPEYYRITNFSPYKVHQRLAKSMRVGPFVLAADAAHLCNPFGGLGLTGGIVDVGGLFDCLTGIHQGKADDSILDIYSRVRSEMYQKFIDPISSENLVRMYDSDPSTLVERDPFFQMIENTKDNPAAMADLIKGISVISHDFTQYYNKDNESAGRSEVSVQERVVAH